MEGENRVAWPQPCAPGDLVTTSSSRGRGCPGTLSQALSRNSWVLVLALGPQLPWPLLQLSGGLFHLPEPEGGSQALRGLPPCQEKGPPSPYPTLDNAASPLDLVIVPAPTPTP